MDDDLVLLCMPVAQMDLQKLITPKPAAHWKPLAGGYCFSAVFSTGLIELFQKMGGQHN